MPDFRFDQDTRLHYEECGSGSHPVIMLHGLGASLETWFDIKPYLLHYKLYLLDLKGFGLSSKPDHSGYGVRDHVPYVIAFIRHLGIRECSLLGHSYGGILATFILLQAPSHDLLIRVAILIDAPVVSVPLPLFVKVLQVPFLRTLIVSCLSPSLQASFILHHLGYSPDFASSSRIRRYAQFFALSGTRRALIKTAQALQSDRDISLQFSGTFQNVLFIWGANDPIFPLSLGNKMPNFLPESHLEVIPACGHIPHEEKPAATATIIMNFMEQCKEGEPNEIATDNIL